MPCPPLTKAWSYIDTCAGVTVGTWAAYLQECVIELHNTSQNPPETNPYHQELCNTQLQNKNYINPLL